MAEVDTNWQYCGLQVVRLDRIAIRPHDQAVQDSNYLVGVGARINDSLLRPAQFGRRNHFHRLGNLLGVLYRANASTDV